MLVFFLHRIQLVKKSSSREIPKDNINWQSTLLSSTRFRFNLFLVASKSSRQTKHILRYIIACAQQLARNACGSCRPPCVPLLFLNIFGRALYSKWMRAYHIWQRAYDKELDLDDPFRETTNPMSEDHELYYLGITYYGTSRDNSGPEPRRETTAM